MAALGATENGNSNGNSNGHAPVVRGVADVVGPLGLGAASLKGKVALVTGSGTAPNSPGEFKF